MSESTVKLNNEKSIAKEHGLSVYYSLKKRWFDCVIIKIIYTRKVKTISSNYWAARQKTGFYYGAAFYVIETEGKGHSNGSTKARYWKRLKNGVYDVTADEELKVCFSVWKLILRIQNYQRMGF